MDRILERQIMDDEQQVLAYTKADFSDSNQRFCNLLFSDYGAKIKNIIDLGCGPADIPIRLVSKNPALKITAVDASRTMITLARQALRESGYEKQIITLRDKLPGVNFKHRNFDTVISKDLLHHLPDPMILWNEITKLAKTTNKELVVYVMDLCRPETIAEARKIVNNVSGDEPDILKKDFLNSLLAAFTIDEVKEQLAGINLNLRVSKISGRHLLAKGILKASF